MIPVSGLIPPKQSALYVAAGSGAVEVIVLTSTVGHGAIRTMAPWCCCEIQKSGRRGRGEDHDGCHDHVNGGSDNTNDGSQTDGHDLFLSVGLNAGVLALVHFGQAQQGDTLLPGLHAG